METFLRAIAIFVEVLLLTAALGCFFFGLWLAAFDLGLNKRYGQILTLALVVGGVIAITFFISHLITFYPSA